MHDALVIGGGPAGATAALLLARAGWSVALVERQAFPRPKVCGDYLSGTNLPLLDRLGVGAVFRRLAGPHIRRVGLFSGRHALSADLPRPAHDWGRALSRQRFDALLLDQARRAGAHLRQPWAVRTITRRGGAYTCRIEAPPLAPEVLAARVVIAAHGSWHPGTLLTQPPRRPAAAADLLGFKCHFEGAALAPDLMPLLAFSGGYGGMVCCEDNLVSISCCVRRDTLTAARRRYPGSAGEALLQHVRKECGGVREALAGARAVGSWLSAGPIRPGMRMKARDGIFLIGNAAGEAHPAIAEGITIALQSAWLLTQRLIAWRHRGGLAERLPEVAAGYAADWQRHFAPRLRLSALVAHWAMRPALVASVLPALRCFPSVLTGFARLSGKAHTVV